MPGSERRPSITANLAEQGLQFEFVDGVQVSRRLMDQVYDDRRFRRRYGRSSTPNEVGAVLAHQRAYERIADCSSPAAIVLEDDAILTPSFAMVAEAAANHLKGGDVALLFERGNIDALRRQRVTLPLEHELAYVHRLGPWGAVATIVTQKAATRLRVFGKPIQSAADDWYLFSRRVIVRAVLPGITLHDESRPSEVGADRSPPQLDKPGFPERIRYQARMSRLWQSHRAHNVRELVLLQRATLLRALIGD